MNLKKVLATAVAAVAATALMAAPVLADSLASLSFTGAGTPGVQMTNDSLGTSGEVSEIDLVITTPLAMEDAGDGAPYWNDWCGELVSVETADGVKYYDFGGAQVGWGVDMDGDDTADTAGVDQNSWLGSMVDGTVTIKIPVGSDAYTVNVYDNCWDSAPDVAHLEIASGVVVYSDGSTMDITSLDGAATTADDTLIATADDTVAQTADASFAWIIAVAVLGCGAVAFAVKKRFSK